MTLEAVKKFLVFDLGAGFRASQKIQRTVPSKRSAIISSKQPSQTSKSQGTIVPPSVRIDPAKGGAMYWDIFTSQYSLYTPLSQEGKSDRELRKSGLEFPANLDWDIFTSQYKPAIRKNQ